MRKTTLLSLALFGLSHLSGCSGLQHAYMKEAFACADPLSIECTVARQESSAERRRLESQTSSGGYSGSDATGSTETYIPAVTAFPRFGEGWWMPGESFLATELSPFLCEAATIETKEDLNRLLQTNGLAGRGITGHSSDDFNSLRLYSHDRAWPFSFEEAEAWLYSRGSVMERWETSTLGKPPYFSTILGKPPYFATNGHRYTNAVEFWGECEERNASTGTCTGEFSGSIKYLIPDPNDWLCD